MLNINVTVRDVALNISRDFTIAIDEQLQVRDLIALLVRKLAWPEQDIAGQPVSYALIVERVNSRVLLTGDEMIRAAGFLNGDLLTIGPVTGGALSASQPRQADASTTRKAPYTMAPLNRS